MEPEQKCSLCGKVHFDNCDPADVPKTSEQARKLAQRCYVQTVEAAAEVRARFSQYLKQLQDEEAAIDTFLISFEKFIWHICILNRLNWQMGFRELGTDASSSGLLLILRLAPRSELYQSQEVRSLEGGCGSAAAPRR